MFLIEPCCAERHFRTLRNAIAGGGSADFEGYDDMSLTELLHAMLGRYEKTRMVIAAPELPDQSAAAVARWMRQQWARMDGKGTLDVVSRMTLVTDLSGTASPEASSWLKDNPFGERLRLVDVRQDDTVILLPDLAVVGPVNLRYGRHFVARATTNPERIAALWEKYETLAASVRKEEEEPSAGDGLSPAGEGGTPEKETGDDTPKDVAPVKPSRPSRSERRRRR